VTDLDSPTDPAPGWQLEHLQKYVATDGADGFLWNGAPTLLLTTKGRRSGKARRTPLIFAESAGRYLVIASKGGSPEHPDWYRNLAAEPRVQVQINGDRFEARARTATAEEKPPLWALMSEKWPHYDSYQAKTDREIPLVVLERVS
jgi:deazaflavin-dependent oxidoreductase (nitroreductase family)